MSRNLILSVHWEDGYPDACTAAMAERERHAGHGGRGLVVSFDERTTREEGFAGVLNRLDVAEVLKPPFYPTQEHSDAV